MLMIKCNECNKTNHDENKYCIYCGNKLVSPSLYTDILNSLDGVVIALLVKVAKIDGNLTQEEANYFSKIFDIFSNKKVDSQNTRKIYKQILDNEKNKFNNIDYFCKKLTDFDLDSKFKIDIIRIFIELAVIDDDFDEKEENIIVKIVHCLDIEFSVYQNIKKEYLYEEASNSNNNSFKLTLEESYRLLESNISDSIDIIKKNYRRLMNEYHYDKIKSKDLPKDMMAFAEEKAKKINYAYELIKKSRKE